MSLKFSALRIVSAVLIFRLSSLAISGLIALGLVLINPESFGFDVDFSKSYLFRHLHNWLQLSHRWMST